MEIINRIVKRWADFKHQRYLKKMGWTEEAFQRRTDSKVCYRAQTVRDFYPGYAHLHIYDDSRAGPFRGRDWTDVYREINEWCQVNLTGAWRDDIHRVYEQNGIDVDGDVHRELFINDIGSQDVLVYAFDNEHDHFLFTLKWS